MTSSRKKYHPAGTPAPTAASTPASGRSASRRTWVIRVLAVLGVAAGLAMAFVGAGPDAMGGWGKLLLIVPGMIIAAGSFAAFVETTSLARSRRHLR
jgi:hypothetical protein